MELIQCPTVVVSGSVILRYLQNQGVHITLLIRDAALAFKIKKIKPRA